MNDMKHYINYLLTLKPTLPEDSYRDDIVETLTPPAWYHPIKRRRFYKDFDIRVGLVMAEYAKDLLHAIGGKTKTPHNVDNGTDTVETPNQATN